MNKGSQMGFVASSSDHLFDAKLGEHQLCGSTQCPGCGHKLEEKPDWVGLPAGVKFDPTDQELIEHLEGKVVGKGSKSHPSIDVFIPTIEGENGICYTHPEKLPGVTRDGLSRHFFHRPSKAYTTGTRKRRKILVECGGETRWHKTGKTRPVMVNGKQRGCKKILVLYTNFGKNRKPQKMNWVMHQYHLGQREEEKEGELVVSKIFYQTQPRQCSWSAAGDGNSAAGSCSSHLIRIPTSEDTQFSTIGAADVGPSMPAVDNFCFLPCRKPFDEQAGNIGEASRAKEAQAAASMCQVRDMGRHHVTREPQLLQQPDEIANAAFHMISRASPSSSTIIPPPVVSLHHSFHSARSTMLPNQEFQQHHDQLGGQSAFGLEELIMGCTSTHHEQDPSSITDDLQEEEWFKYSAFWPDPLQPDRHT